MAVPAPAKAPYYILYVDDEAANRMIFERSFERDFPIKTAETAERGLEIMATEPISVLITDQRLPGMLGTDMLAIAKERHPSVIRMVLTAYSELEIVLRAINEGLASRYILKPWLRPMLHEVLTWAMEMQLKLIEVERLSTIGTLMASIAHDIKNPIGYISAYVETLDQCVGAFNGWVSALRANSAYAAAFELPQAAAALDELAELPGIIRDLNQGVSHVFSIVDGIQTQARRSSGPLVPADPAVAIEYARKLVQGTVSARGGALKVETPAEALPIVAMSTAELSQVLINLLTNAAHALDGTPREREVQLKTRPAAGGVEFQVIDTGQGMPAEVQEHAFDQFFTTKAPGVGTGLGLAICKRLVEAAGGRISLASAQGRGTTVTFWVPEAPALNGTRPT
jgi:two-component system NtrC family sensor kinase